MQAPLQFPLPKKAGASITYRVRFLAPDGSGYLAGNPPAQLTSGTVVATPSDLLVSGVLQTESDVYFVATGGTAGQTYRFDLTITTDSGVAPDIKSVFLQVVA